MTVREYIGKRAACFRAYRRGVRLLSLYMPYFFLLITIHAFVMAVTPYVTLWLLSHVVEALGNGNIQQAWLYAAITVGTDTALLLCGGSIKRFKEAKWEQLYHATDRLLTDTLLRMDHATVCDPITRTKLDRVREDMHALGAGLVKIPDLYQSVLRGTCGALSAVVTVWGVFGAPLSGLAAWETVACLLTAAVVFIGNVWLSRSLPKRESARVASLDREYYHFYDAVSDPTLLADRCLYPSEKVITRYLERVDDALFGKDGIKKQTLRKRRVRHALAATGNVLFFGAVCAAAGWAVLNGAFGIGAAWCYIGALTRMMTDVKLSVAAWDDASANYPHLQTVFDFLDIPPQLYRGSLTTEKRSDGDYEIVFSNVSFRYPAQAEYALHNVTATLRRGDRIAVVGENGSGKSTFVKLLCRLYDPDEGHITLGGIDIRKYRYEEYAALIAAVFQDFGLFDDTYYTNVAGTPDYDRECVQACLEAVGADTAEDRPLQAATLSAGEAQKIAMARALYKNAPFIVFDEPTASLDPAAEARLYAQFDRMVADRTALFVSHRLSSCRFCHEIWVFDGGEIVQRGSHEELIADVTGKYAKLWQAQAQYYTDT